MKAHKELMNYRSTPTAGHVPSMLEEFKTRLVTPMFTAPRHPNDILQIMREREILSAHT